MLGLPSDVERMVLGDGSSQSGILEHMKRGSYLIDHTTSSPSLAERIAKKGKEKTSYLLMFLFQVEILGREMGS